MSRMSGGFSRSERDGLLKRDAMPGMASGLVKRSGGVYGNAAIHSWKAGLISARALTVAVAAASRWVGPMPALAQQALIEEEVTARKCSESLRDAPIAVQAFTSDRIEDLGTPRFEDVAVLSPSVAFVSRLSVQTP